MKKVTDINSLAVDGIKFSGIAFLVEIFPAPIPERIFDTDIEDILDLVRMSANEGYDEFFVPHKEYLQGESGGKNYQFSRVDFVRWQLMRFSEKTIFQLINKTDCDITQILDANAEYEKDPDYYPEGWLNPYDDTPGNFEKGLQYISRVKKEAPEEFYRTLIDSIIDPDCGVLEHLETEINDNLNEVRQLYSEWVEPLMIVSKGKFFPYIDSESDGKLIMDDYKVECMYIRNNDEGDI